MVTLAWLCYLLSAGAGAPAAPEPGLVAYYPCDEGHGSVLRDAGGQGYDGAVHGATFQRFGEGWALRLDGVDDFADCGEPPALALTTAVTLEVWARPSAVPPVGEPAIAGRDYASYVLTYYTDGQVWWYISGGGNNCKAPVSPGTWHHLVGTFDGQVLRLYVDGRLADTRTSAAPTAGRGGPFRIGASTGNVELTRGAHFAGLVDEVRVYDRAVSAEEVQRRFRTSHLSHALDATCVAYPYAGEVGVRLSTRGLGELPPGAVARVSLTPPGRAQALAAATVPDVPSWGTVAARLNVGKLAAGRYRVRAEVVDRAGRRVGRQAAATLTWPGRPSWPEGDASMPPLLWGSRQGLPRPRGMDGTGAPSMRVLNNLVTELLNTRPPADQTTFELNNPREGWVFVASRGRGVRVLLEHGAGAELLTAHAERGTEEAMRRLPAGTHRLRVALEPGGRLTRLIVRAIPELIYAQCGADPHVTAYGAYDWPYLGRHVLPHLNTMVGSGADAERPLAEEWRRQGKRWIVACGLPGLGNDTPITAEEVEAAWRDNPGLRDPLLDGIIVDEFLGGDSPQYPAWTEAFGRLTADPWLQGKAFYPYCSPLQGAPASQAFMRAVLESGNRLALERYLPEQRTEELAQAYLDTLLREQALDWERVFPGSVQQMVVCVGYLCAPPESLNVDPGVNYKVWLDMQLHLVANDPAFWRVGGLMTYLSSYADEEVVRFAGKLFRHYAIEGRTDRLTADPYVLPHVRSPDLEEGLAGWQVQAAEEGSISTGSMPGYSWLQGRYPPTSQGDTFLCLRRSGRGPNTVTQTLRALEPGRTYSLKAYSSVWRELGTEQQPALSLRVSGARLLPERCFRHAFPNCYSHTLGPYSTDHPAWLNYHQLVFVADAPEAQLAISDWSAPDTPGGPVGQELAVNFIEVQPYEVP